MVTTKQMIHGGIAGTLWALHTRDAKKQEDFYFKSVLGAIGFFVADLVVSETVSSLIPCKSLAQKSLSHIMTIALAGSMAVNISTVGSRGKEKSPAYLEIAATVSLFILTFFAFAKVWETPCSYNMIAGMSVLPMALCADVPNYVKMLCIPAIISLGFIRTSSF